MTQMTSDLRASARDGDPVALCRALVAVPSVNPDVEDGGDGEAAVGEMAAGWLEAWGFRVEVEEVAPGRVNVVGRHGEGGGRLLLNGHLDTVGVRGMSHDPFSGAVREGRIWGRGAADMKGGIASLLAAALRLSREGHGGELIVALTADEEWGSVGMEALVRDGPPADAAVVCEPTELAVMPAHRGFSWVELDFRGRAAHGSRPDLGIDAIRHAGRFLAALDRWEAWLSDGPRHPLLGTGSIHAGTIRGGTAPPVYPEACRLVLERRTLPGETPGDVEAEARRLISEVQKGVPDLSVEVGLGLSRPATEVDRESPLVRGLLEGLEEEGRDPEVAGMSAWVDAALLNQTGTPAVCFGPGSIARAHGAEEWVETEELEACTRVLIRFGRRFLSPGA